MNQNKRRNGNDSHFDDYGTAMWKETGNHNIVFRDLVGGRDKSSFSDKYSIV